MGGVTHKVLCTWQLLGLAVKETWLALGRPVLALAGWAGLENATLIFQGVHFWQVRLRQKWRYGALQACVCLKVVSSETNLGFKGFEYIAIHSDNDTAKILSLYYEALYHSLVKERPCEEHLTNRGVGALQMFPHLTTKDHLCHVYSYFKNSLKTKL